MDPAGRTGSAEPDLLEIYSSYVPPPVLRHLAVDPTGQQPPPADHAPAAILFADISGFTSLAEGLARQGSKGAERLSQILNRYFEELLELVASHGGEVASFAGDALVALWPMADREQSLADASRRAAQCALAVQARLSRYDAGDGAELSLRIGIGAGEMFASSVGGERDRWMYFVGGPPLGEAGDAKRQARPGQVVVTSSAWASLPAGTFRGRALPDGAVLLEDVLEPLALHPTDRPMPEAEALTTLRGYIPGAIVSRLEAGQSDWLAELRRVTVVFVRVRGVEYGSATDAISDQVSSIMQLVQAIVYDLEGSITQFTNDEKGTVLLASFGLPPRTHEDDPARAVQAALKTQDAIRDLGLNCAVGVATGQAFCGDVGGPTRREFTLIGDVVNLAARLQEVQTEGVLIDEATSEVARGAAIFQQLPRFELKGKAEPVAVYRPLAAPAGAARRPPLLGREREVAVLGDRLEVLAVGESGVVIVEGEAGIGKSRLIAELLERARAKGFHALVGTATAVESSTPFHPWREVLSQLFDVSSMREHGPRGDRVLATLEGDPQAVELAPLLNEILGLDLPATETTGRMTDRADPTQELIVRILQRSAREQGIVIVLEDAHWLDSASWAVARLVALQVAPLLLVIVRRPVEEPRESRELRDLPGAVTFQLGGLLEPQTRDLVVDRLGLSRVSEGLVSLVQERSEGNPFFAEELIYVMRDQGLIVVRDGECRIALSAGGAAPLTPATVQSVITSRLDRLTPAQQMTVKVASVIGRVFPLATLAEVYPIEADRPELRHLLEDLQRLDIALPDQPEPDETYAFRHAITREVAYKQLPPSLRRKLHRSVAEWYESRDGEGLSADYPVLAHHWTEAEVSAKAIEYLVKAGEQALASFANQEAVRLLSEALSLDGQREGGADRLQRAGWELQLGQAYVNWSHYGAGLSHLKKGLELLDRPVPGSSLGQLAGVVVEVIRQFVHRLRPLPGGEWAERTAESRLAASSAYERVLEVAYFTGEDLLSVYAAFRGLNLAEKAGGPSPQLARAYSNVAAILGFIPLRRLRRIADAYIQRAADVLDRVGSREAESWVSLAVGTHYAGVGDWNLAQEHLEKVVSICDQLGNSRGRGDGASQLMALQMIRGDLKEGYRLAEELYEAGKRRDYRNHQAWGLQGMALYLLGVGKHDEALRSLEELEGLLADLNAPDEVLESELAGLRSSAFFRRSEFGQALTAAQAMGEVADRSPLPTNFSVLSGYTGGALALLGMLEAQHRLPDDMQRKVPSIRSVASSSCKRLGGYSRVFPIGKPRAAICQGLQHWLSGDRVKARQAWSGALRSAVELELPHDQGLALYELGRHLDSGDPMRKEHLEQAIRIFEQIGADYDLAHAQLELARPRSC